MIETSAVRVRIPPSPTGFCHVGTARMAILNYLFARKHKGQIIFRSEDTDKERSKPEFEADIIESLTWLELSWDEFYRQSERIEIYREALQQLIREGKAYVSEEESKKEPGVQVHPVRLKNPGTKITFTDLIRGEITFDTTELGNFVIARAEDDPLYHCAVVVDDAKMGITHVIRGEDHISNTPRQILIQEALGFPRPAYAHYPLHLSTDRAKLSKRTGDVAVREFREKGYLPQALLNYLATLGWSAPSGKEILTLDTMIHEFALEDVHKSGAVFDLEKLRWYNRHYMLALSENEFRAHANSTLKASIEARGLVWSEDIGTSLAPIIRERIAVWDDLKTLVAEGELDFFFADPTLDSARLPQKGVSVEDTLRHLQTAQKLLTELPVEGYSSAESLKKALWDYATEKGRGAVLWPLRYSLTGLERSPDPFVVASAIGREAVLRRIKTALASLAVNSSL